MSSPPTTSPPPSSAPGTELRRHRTRGALDLERRAVRRPSSGRPAAPSGPPPCMERGKSGHIESSNSPLAALKSQSQELTK
eukprot:4988563-Prymnesium_polylepis.1